MNNVDVLVENASVAAAAEVDARVANALAHAFPDAGAPSDDLKRRVRLLAARHDEQRTRRALWRRRFRAGLALVGAATVLAAALIAAPRLRAAATLEQMARAMDNTRSAHMTTWQVSENAPPAKSGETWYQNGRWRIENKQNVQIYANGVLWTYEPQAALARFQRNADGPFAFNGSGFSLAATLRDFARFGWLRRMEIRELGDMTQSDGRRVRRISVRQDSEPAGRMVLLVDTQTDLLVGIEYQRSDGESNMGWTTVQRSDIRYNEALAAGFFAPDFPPETRVLDVAAGRQQWERRLARGLARRRVGERTLVVRDVQVNAGGDVFVLYTAGAHPDDMNDSGQVTLTDEFGTPYVRRILDGFQPYLFGRRTNPGYVFGGEKLEGVWWTPKTEQTQPWKPRRLRLTFRVSPIVRHESWDDWEKAKANVKPGEPLPLAGKALLDVPKQNAAFSFFVARPAATLLPEYMPYMGYPLDGYVVQIRRATARADHFRDTERNFARALACYREAIALGEAHSRDTGQPLAQPDEWFAVYEVLRALGRNDEARAALERADTQNRNRNGNSYLSQRIAEARRELDAQSPN